MADFVESFEAVLMETTIQHRSMAADIGRLDAFVMAVKRQCARVTGKPGIPEADAEQVRALADAAIERAKRHGRVLAYSPAAGA
jgi:hypothetical protein